MTPKPVLFLRVTWLFFAVGYAWQVLHGEMIRPLHPMNLAAVLSLVLGVASIWKGAPRYKITSGVCGLVYCAVASVQCFALMWILSDGGNLTATWGPLEITGEAAPFAMWSPLILHAVCSLMVIWSTACEIDRNAGPPDILKK